jgi:hypothetical protein
MRNRRFLGIALALVMILSPLLATNTQYDELWVCDSTGTLETDAVSIMHVVYVPSAVNDDLILTDSDDDTAVVLKAGPSDVAPVHISFAAEGGRLVYGLKVGTIDGGTAYVYLKQ